MSSCTVDAEMSPTFRNSFKSYCKKHKNLGSDFDEQLKEIEADYKSACLAARVPNRQLDGVEVWKYAIASKDLQRSSRNAFRAIGVFLTPDDGKNRTMYFLLFYWKGEQQEFTTSELTAAMKKLKTTIAAKTASGDGR